MRVEAPQSTSDVALPVDRARVLAVDDAPANLALIRQLLTRDGYEVATAGDGLEALDEVARLPPDIVLTDVVMPRCDGIHLCRELKSHPTTCLIPVVLITSLRGREERLRGIDAGADDFLLKPFDPHELRARVRSLVRLKRHTDDLDSAEAVILSLARTVEARDAYTEGHCQRLSTMAAAVGRRLALPPADVAALERGGILHDVGKIGIPDSILLKPGALTREEYEVMKQHTLIGDRLCSELRLLRSVRPIVRHHHERLDGSGYPDGLAGSDLPLLAQIMGVVDVFDALTTTRPYRQPHPAERAFDELRGEASRGWRDPALVEMLATLYHEGAFGGR